MWTEACPQTNFCKIRVRQKRNIARSLRRNGKCEFSARLFSQRPVFWQQVAAGTDFANVSSTIA
jgi:hypothetical protein